MRHSHVHGAASRWYCRGLSVVQLQHIIHSVFFQLPPQSARTLLLFLLRSIPSCITAVVRVCLPNPQPILLTVLTLNDHLGTQKVSPFQRAQPRLVYY